MLIDPIALASITSAVTLLGHEYAKGIAGEAGKATWTQIKSLFDWHTDPPVAEIPEKVAGALTASPETAGKLVEILKSQPPGAVSSLVQNLTITGGKVIFAQTVQNITM